MWKPGVSLLNQEHDNGASILALALRALPLQ